MPNRTPLEIFAEAIKDLGGPSAAAEKLKRKQSTISGYLKDGNAPADVCMRIEIESEGRFRADEMRPDLAEVFRLYQDPARPKRRATPAPKEVAAKPGATFPEAA